jgi:hypothetical protein
MGGTEAWYLFLFQEDGGANRINGCRKRAYRKEVDMTEGRGGGESGEVKARIPYLDSV